MHSSDFSIRLCTLQELDDIMDLQDRICATITQPDLFASTCREENASYLTPPNVIYGVFKQKRLIAYASLAFPKNASDNLGWDLGWNSTQIRHCAKLDTIVVDPDFRGLGLQRTLIDRCISHTLKQDPDSILLTTVSPSNLFSLRNVQNEGFQILKRMLKYGGKERYVLGYCPSGQFPAVQ